MYLQMTSRNAIVTYQTIGTDVLPNAQVLQGWADDTFLTLDMTAQVEVKKSLDNIMIGWVKPVVMTGKLMVLPNGPAQQILQTVQTFQTNSGIIAPGILTVTYPSLLATVTYNNFTLTSPFVGYSIANERTGNVEVSFAADIPDSASLNTLLQLGLASIGSF